MLRELSVCSRGWGAPLLSFRTDGAVARCLPTSRAFARGSCLGRRASFHALRHTHATLLLGANVHPKVVSERLGHATVGSTLDTYSHVLPNLQEEAARKIDALLARAGGRRRDPE